MLLALRLSSLLFSLSLLLAEVVPLAEFHVIESEFVSSLHFTGDFCTLISFLTYLFLSEFPLLILVDPKLCLLNI